MEAKRLGNIFGYTGGNFSGNVYDKFSLSPTLNTMQGGNKQPMIIIYDDYNHRVRADQTCIGTLTTNIGNDAFGNATKLIEIYNSGKDDCSMSIKNMNPKCLNSKGGRNGVEGIQPSIQDRVYDPDSISVAVTTAYMPSYLEKSSFRIRKLTPKECYRLMGFDDESFERAEQVNSNTQLYKQAGNSIVVDVLVAIFDSLLIHGCSAWLDELLEDKEIDDD